MPAVQTNREALMRITLTGRRLALAAVVVLGGVAAPLAYATIGNAGKAASAPVQKPTRIVTPVVQAAPTAVGDPYQLAVYLTKSPGLTCANTIVPPVGPFVLESVAVLSHGGAATSFSLGLDYKRGQPGDYAGEADWYNIPLDAGGDGQATFNLLIRPNLLQNTAVGDLFDLRMLYGTRRQKSWQRPDGRVSGVRSWSRRRSPSVPYASVPWPPPQNTSRL